VVRQVSAAAQLTGRRVSSWRQATGDSWRPTDQDIAERAHAIYLNRGGTRGSDVNDWLQAERELFFQRTWALHKLSI
jgi:hypothetical protein